MTERFEYDRAKSPPMPVLPIKIGATAGSEDAAVVALVDTGADITLIPDRLARQLRLPAVGEVTVRGVTGARRVSIYGAELEIAGTNVAVRAAGLGTDTLIGRDVINQWTVVLRGPEQVLELEGASSGGE